MSGTFSKGWAWLKRRSQAFRIGSSYWALYRLLDDAQSRCILIVGIFCALAAGIPLPLIAVVFRGIIAEFPPPEHQIQEAIHYILAISSAYFAFTWIWTVCWSIVGGRISRRLQELLVERIVGLDMQYFDLEPLDLTSILTADTQTIQRGTSEKVGLFIQSISYFLATFITGFVIAPALTGVLLAAILPCMILLVTVGSSFVSRYSTEATRLGEAAANSAEQAIRSVQVVQAFGAIDLLCAKHAAQVRAASHFAYRKSVYAGIMLGLVYFVAYSAQALAFYWGTQLGGNSGTIYAVVFLILDASFVVNQVGPFIQTIAMASSAGGKVLKLINHEKPAIDPYACGGEILAPSHLEKDIVLEQVSFSYPARSEKPVLKDVNLRFPAASSTAIVGPSGSGKSSLAGLLLRLYDPESGKIRIGGVELPDFNVKSLRSNIAIVDQEPVLFTGSILDNICAGIVNIEDLTAEQARQRCRQAAQDANATDFIDQLEDGLDTHVSSHSSLSGGQRQRICLARALVRRPAIVVLDEPTSALDSLSEAKILDSIHRLCKTGCTVIMIAHRLATVKDLDNIVVLKDGRVLEQGTHQELMDEGGAYKALVDAQQMESPADSQASSTGSSNSSSSSLSTLCNERDHDNDIREQPPQPALQLPATSQTAAFPGQILNPAVLRRGSEVASQDLKTVEKKGQHQNDEPKTHAKMGSWQLLTRTINHNKPESPLLVLGLFAAGIMGSIIVYEAIVFGNLITIINHESTTPDFEEKIRFFCLMFLIISLITMFMSSTSNACFGLVSDAFLGRIRDSTLHSVLSQDQAFFHKNEHSAHRLITAINADSNFVAGLSGNIIAALVSVCFNIVSGITVAIAYAWAIALILLTIIPAIVLAGFLRVSMLSKFDKKHTESFKHAAALASEAVRNIRTVAAYGREHDVLQQYRTAIAKPYRQSFWYCVFGDLALTLNYCVVYFTYALAYWWGSREVRNGKFTEREFFTMLPAFLLAAQQSGQLFTAAPELVQARSAAGRLYALLDEKPTIIAPPDLATKQSLLGFSRGNSHAEADNVLSTYEKSTTSKSVSQRSFQTCRAEGKDSPVPANENDDSSPGRQGAEVVLERVSLSYPRHPEKLALHDISLSIKPGQSVGIVGPSGAGKSSFISLLERFFDPTTGSVLVNGKDIKQQDVGLYRAQIALVSQEPSLFAGSVGFNIALGASPYGPRPLQEDIEATCQRIGMHDFIMSLPEGYATECGAGGSKLSGGQKQRVAIARALIRDPQLLILDEATSALDSQSEREVQKAIAVASEGRTTITVAHRLSTIQQADTILCFDKGKLIEQGTHDDLVKLGGVYASMATAQTLS